MFFKKKVLTVVSFYDWVARLSSALEDSIIQVNLSEKEDSFENVIRVFRTKTRNVLSLISGVEVKVDIRGVYILDEFTHEKIYILSFCNGKILELPLDESLTLVSCQDYVVGTLKGKYNHYIAKLEDQKKRLQRESLDAESKIERLKSYLEVFEPLVKKVALQDVKATAITSEKPDQE
jgi:hypothetical protein